MLDVAVLTTLAWFPIILLLFAVLPPRSAVISSFIGAWLLLPNIALPLPGLPDVTKATVTSVGALIGTALFHHDRLISGRPRWFDLPMLIWCSCPFASSLSNGLGAYDGASAFLHQSITWGLPYLIGRLYLSDLDGLRELAVGFVLGGLTYILPTLWELRMSPHLSHTFYGIGGWTGLRYGGYRPKVFLSNGLEHGMWMTAASLAGVALWSSGSLSRLWGIPSGWWLLGLIPVTVLCKSSGALVLLAVGVALIYWLRWTKRSFPLLVLIAITTLYMGLRGSSLWSGKELLDLTSAVFPADRSQSLEFRLNNEDLLAPKAMQRPALGWAGWGRARVYDESGRDISITDGLWIVVLGNYGLVGLTSFTAAMYLPVLLLIGRCPAPPWKTPAIVPAALFAVFICLTMIDNLSNGMVNPVYTLAGGGLSGLVGRRRPAGREGATPGLWPTDALSHPAGDHPPSSGTSEPAVLPGERYRLGLAGRYSSLGRTSKDQGRSREAEAAWRVALAFWQELVTDAPGRADYRQGLANCQNDLAWLLIQDLEPRSPAPRGAIPLAVSAIELMPECATYWNTLGAALCRAGDSEAAAAVLRRSVELSGGGTGYDHLLLALVSWQLGDREQTIRWLDRAEGWVARHDPGHPDLLRFQSEAVTLLDGDRG